MHMSRISVICFTLLYTRSIDDTWSKYSLANHATNLQLLKVRLSRIRQCAQLSTRSKLATGFTNQLPDTSDTWNYIWRQLCCTMYQALAKTNMSWQVVFPLCLVWYHVACLSKEMVLELFNLVPRLFGATSHCLSLKPIQLLPSRNIWRHISLIWPFPNRFHHSPWPTDLTELSHISVCFPKRFRNQPKFFQQ